MNENEAMKDLIKHRQGSAREVERLKTFTTPMGSGTHTEPITGDPNKMDFATYKKWREQNQ